MSSIDRLFEIFPELARISREAWVVGGALRDLAYGMTPVEADIATRDAAATARAFARSVRGRLVELGRDRFLTYRVVAGQREFDFTEIEGTLADDLHRRDCTIDAMAVSLADRRLVDPYDGGGDAARRIIRMIDSKNFVDDPLRILKLTRLSVTHYSAIEETTFRAMKQLRATIGEVARERVLAELELIFEHARAGAGARILHALQYDERFFGVVFDEARCGRIDALLEGDIETRLAAAVHDDDLERVVARLGLLPWPVRRARNVARLVASAATIAAAADGDMAIALHDAGRENGERLVLLLSVLGSHAKSIEAARLVADGSLFSVTSHLRGDEIRAMTGVSGRRLGEIKRSLLEAQIRGEVRSRADAEVWVRARR